ncbi:kinase-like protein [Wilcoxina mikolae CBS 423.85]|nr:kinase-like protein [Wilcoxina mikolae CBS 423.85]
MASSSNSTFLAYQTYGGRDQDTRRLKRLIERLAVPSTEWIDGCPVPAEPSKQFFPINSLRDKVLNTETIRAILCHRCDYCREQIQWLPQADINSTVQRIVGNTGRPLLAHTAVSIFALLIFIENPLLIFSFLHKGINDDTFARYTENYEPDTLYELWPDFHRHHRQASKAAALNFRIQKWRFAVPHMSHGEHTRYEVRHILPFAMQKELGQEGTRKNGGEQDCDYVGHDKGANGRVFKVELHQGYGNFGYAETQSMIYARKEITASDALYHILDETNNLQKAKQLHHPHLIKPVKTYQQGIFNIIFPYAKANLHRYLRIPILGAPRSPPDLTQNRLWPQILGVAEGLKLIINGSGNPGVHCNLKPQNILVLEIQRVDTLMISDFGQARLLDRGDRFTLRQTFGGGTDSYTPPESSIGFVRKAQQNKYDIWPLGIVLLEVLAFVVKGESGPKQLDEVRETSESRGVDSRFWRIPDRTPRGELKPEIVRFMNEIRDAPEKEENRVFVGKVLDLAKDMLHPDPDRRISIERVVQRMRAMVVKVERRKPEVEALEEQEMETSLKVRDEEHLDTLASMSNLTSTYQSHGDAEELHHAVQKSLDQGSKDYDGFRELQAWWGVLSSLPSTQDSVEVIRLFNCWISTDIWQTAVGRVFTPNYSYPLDMASQIISGSFVKLHFSDSEIKTSPMIIPIKALYGLENDNDLRILEQFDSLIKFAPQWLGFRHLEDFKESNDPSRFLMFLLGIGVLVLERQVDRLQSQVSHFWSAC